MPDSVSAVTYDARICAFDGSRFRWAKVSSPPMNPGCVCPVTGLIRAQATGWPRGSLEKDMTRPGEVYGLNEDY